MTYYSILWHQHITVDKKIHITFHRQWRQWTRQKQVVMKVERGSPGLAPCTRQLPAKNASTVMLDKTEICPMGSGKITCWVLSAILYVKILRLKQWPLSAAPNIGRGASDSLRFPAYYINEASLRYLSVCCVLETYLRQSFKYSQQRKTSLQIHANSKVTSIATYCKLQLYSTIFNCYAIV